MASNSFCSRSAGSHGLRRRDRQRLARSGAAEQFILPERSVLVRRWATASSGVDRREGARAIRLDAIEGAGGGEAFQHPLVERARVDAAGKIREIAERPVARRDDRFHRLASHAFQRRRARNG